MNFSQAYSQEFYFYVVCNAWVYKERVWEQRGKRAKFGFGAIILSPPELRYAEGVQGIWNVLAEVNVMVDKLILLICTQTILLRICT